MIVPEQQRAYDAHLRFHASVAMLALAKPPRVPPSVPRDLICVRTPKGRDFLWIASPPENRTATIKRIQAVVAKSYNISVLDIVSQRRTKSVIMPRQIAMYLARTMTTRSFPEIGRQFGGRDHTTILSAFNKINGMISKETAFAVEVNLLKQEIAPNANEDSKITE